MLVLKLRQSELANEPIPFITIRRVLKSAGFDLNKDFKREDNFFNDSVMFSQNTGAGTPLAISEPCSS